MRIFWRIIRFALGLAGLTGTLLCLAGIVGCWILYVDAVQRTNRAFGRVEASLDRTRENLTRARDQLERTQRGLLAVRGRVSDATHRLKVRIITGAAAGTLTEIRRIVERATEAALVAEGFLNAVAELPIAERIGLDPDALRETSERLSDAIQIAERLSALLDPAAPEPMDNDVQGPSTRLDELLKQAIGTVDIGVERLNTASERMELLRVRVVRVFTIVALASTVLLVWIGAGQVSLLIHGFRRSRVSVTITMGA